MSLCPFNDETKKRLERLTKLQIGPRIGPSVHVGAGSEGGCKMCLPLITTSKTKMKMMSTQLPAQRNKTMRGDRSLTWN